MKLIVSLLAATAATLQPNWTFIDSSPLVLASLVPVATSGEGLSADSNGVWLASYVLQGSRGVGAIARFDTTGALPPVIRYTDPLYQGLPPSSVRATGDGGVIALSNTTGGFTNPICYVTLYAADGTWRWTATEYTYCDRIVGVDIEGTLVLRLTSGTVLRLGADGSGQVDLDALLPAPAQYAVDTHGTAIYAAYGRPFDAMPSPATIVRIDANATVQPLWQAPANDIAIDRLSVDGAHNVYATGHTSDGHYAAVSVAADGTLRWRQTYALDAAASGQSTHLSDGTLVNFDEDAQLFTARAADGSMAFSVEMSGTPCDGLRTVGCLSIAPNDDILVAALDAASNSVIQRYDPSGQLLASSPFDNDSDRFSMVALGDSTALVATTGIDGNNPLRHFDRDGNAIPPPVLLNDLPAGKEASNWLDTGSSQYLIANGYVTDLFSVSRVDADGTLKWQQVLDTNWLTPSVQQAGNRVCIGDNVQPRVTCEDADTGTLLWNWTLAPPTTLPSDETMSWRLLADGSIALVTSGGSGLLLRHIDANGLAAYPLTLQDQFTEGRVDISPDGIVVVASSTNDKSIRAYRADGSQLYSTPLPAASDYAVYDQVVALTGGGTLLSATLGGGTGASVYLWALAANGSLRWTYDTGGRLVTGFEVSDDTVYALFGADSTTTFSTLQALALADGGARWTNDLRPTWLMRSGAVQMAHYAAATQSIVVTAMSSSAVQALTFDATSGSLRSNVTHACGTFCITAGADGADDGSLHLVLTTLDSVGGLQARLEDIQPAAALVPAGQDGISGAWYATYESGQGFIIDHIGSANTLALAWFTYGTDAVQDPSGLAWYTLQGGIDADATGADLTIYLTDPGTFVSGKVGTHAVGTAHVAFSDCDTGSLSYEFNADTNAGATGFIALSRLSPSTSACRLVGGVTTPAQNANPPANGFDAKQSGSWYDPGTSGQGMELSIAPAGNGNFGLAFGAWFTFDPQGSADDALAQHWFTMQGDLAAATNGKVTLPIYRTIGGTLDGASTHNSIRVGQATLTLADCTHAQLDYAFDHTLVAHAFTALDGHIDLVKLGGCAGP